MIFDKSGIWGIYITNSDSSLFHKRLCDNVLLCVCVYSVMVLNKIAADFLLKSYTNGFLLLDLIAVRNLLLSQIGICL